MGVFKVLVMVLTAMAVYELYNSFNNTVSMPEIDPEPWWASGPKERDNPVIHEFKINVPDKDLKDLKDRLNLPSRLTPSYEGTNFTYGFNTDTLQGILDHWKSNYNWKKREVKLNKYMHYSTKIEGLLIHFMRVRPTRVAGVTVLPLMLLHGWPGTFVEFMDILPILSAPHKGGSIAFEVIVPSIPGYGFSESPVKPGLGVAQTAQIYDKLMKRLGFKQYYIQGGDWGALIANTMGTLYQESILGMSISMLIQDTPSTMMRYALGSFLPSGYVMDSSREAELYPISQHILDVFQETGYLHLQMTKPDTVGVGLSASPEGLLAYILEKFSTWTNREAPNMPDGGFNKNFPIDLDKLLDNVSIYWFTKTITSSMRFYAELGQYLAMHLELIPTKTPTSISHFPNEIYLSPKTFTSGKFLDLVAYVTHDTGGHFAAMEVPHIMADDIFSFVTIVEARKENKKTEL